MRKNKIMKDIELYDYQTKAVNSVFHEWEEEDHRKTLVISATGTGKTIIFIAIAERILTEYPDTHVLILAHRGELLSQAADKIQKHTDIPVSLEKGSVSSHDTPIVVGSVQSLSQDKRLDKFPSDYFKVIIVDEAHHSTSKTYQKVLNHFTDAYIVGVTATPDRMDEKALAKYYDSRAFEYPLVQAILDGNLVPVKVRTIPLKINMRHVRKSAGDYNVSDVGDAILPYLESIADEMEKYCKGRTTLVFTPLIATSQKFMPILKKRGFRVCEVHGSSKDRDEKTKEIMEGKYDVILNAMLYTEGFDAKNIDCIINLRATKSRTLYIQMVGRGCRKCPERGKKDLLLLDFLWQTETFDIMNPAALVASNDVIREKMTEISVSGEQDIFDIEEKAEDEVQKEREGQLAHMLDMMRSKASKSIDPVQYAYSIDDKNLYDYEPMYAWEKDKPTEKQLNYLKLVGFSVGQITTKGQASHIIGVMQNRRERGMSSPKQIKCLERSGFLNVGLWTKEEAGDMITALSDNRWHVPKGINAKTYKPKRLSHV